MKPSRLIRPRLRPIREFRVSKHHQIEKEVPIQVMVPSDIHKQVALIGVENGESIRTVVLRGLKAIGVDVPDDQLVDRRGRRRA
jgi:hypothetical protein